MRLKQTNTVNVQDLPKGAIAEVVETDLISLARGEVVQRVRETLFVLGRDVFFMLDGRDHKTTVRVLPKGTEFVL